MKEALKNGDETVSLERELELDNSALSNEIVRRKGKLREALTKTSGNLLPEEIEILEKLLSVEWPSANDDVWDSIEEDEIDSVLGILFFSAPKDMSNARKILSGLESRLSEENLKKNEGVKDLLVEVRFLTGASDSGSTFIRKMRNFHAKKIRYFRSLLERRGE